jgi:hypothetical protein
MPAEFPEKKLPVTVKDAAMEKGRGTQSRCAKRVRGGDDETASDRRVGKANGAASLR